MSESVIVQIATAVIGLLGTIFAGVMTYFMRRLDLKQTSHGAKLEDIKQTGESTHSLVNGGVTERLGLYAVATARVAELTRDPNDRMIAVAAAKEYEERVATSPQSASDPV